MPHRRHTPRWPSLAVFCLLVLLASAAVARGAVGEYGELTRFGVGHQGGKNPEKGTLNDENRTRLIGVDPRDNSVYVLDEPLGFEIKSGAIIHHYRLQKFTSAGGHYSATASVSFAERSSIPSGEEPAPEAYAESVQGIAVDPSRNRVYLLAVDWREATLAVDHSATRGGASENRTLPVASTLYAFSTVAKGAELVPAEGTKETKEAGKGVLAGPEALLAQSPAPGKALLEPGGITVDPATGDVIVFAHVDEAGEAKDDVQNERDHYVLQRVGPEGKLGARYTDSNNFFVKPEGLEGKPASPVVVGAPGAEHIYLAYNLGLVQIPYSFEGPPSPVAPPGGVLKQATTESVRPESALGSEGPAVGGGLSAAPAPEDRIYAAAKIQNQEESEAGEERSGIAAFSAADGSEIGWTGAQSVEFNEARKATPYLCVTDPQLFETFTAVAAGSGGTVFALAPAWLFEDKTELELEAELTPEQLASPLQTPAVIEFGPEGSGCPTASSPKGLEATVNGAPVESKKVSTSERVTFSAALKQADSLQVEWDFGDGTSETVTLDQQQKPEVQHTFARGGENLLVTAKIHSDDLATPLITLTTHVSVEEAASRPPTALVSGPLTAIIGQPAEFDGSSSFDPAGANQIGEYEWNFGDGHEAKGSAPTVTHVYSSLGSYTVSLIVKNKHGIASAPTQLPSPVIVAEPPPPPSSPGGGSGSGQPSAPNGGQAGQAGTNGYVAATPDAALSSASLTVSGSGVTVAGVSCPAGESSCTGTVTLRSIATRVGKSLTRSFTLASASFTVAGGQVRKVALHLTRRGRALLAHTHTLRALATIVASDPSGARHVRQMIVTLHAEPRARKHKAGR